MTEASLTVPSLTTPGEISTGVTTPGVISPGGTHSVLTEAGQHSSSDQVFSSTQLAELWSKLPQPVALVAGAGVQNAAAGVGLLSQVLAAGLEPELVVAASAGSLTLAPLLLGVDDPSAQAAQLWQEISTSKLIKVGWSRIAEIVGGRGGKPLSTSWREVLEPIVGQASIPQGDEDGITAALVATNLSTNEAKVLREGPLLDALLAAAAFPTLVAPVEREGQILVDGCFCAPTPVVQAKDLGAGSIVVLETGHPGLAGEPTKPTRWFDVVVASVFYQVAATSAHDLFEVAHDLPIVVLSVPQPFGITWDQVSGRIDLGHSAGRSQLASLRDQLINQSGPLKPGIYTTAPEIVTDRRLVGMVRTQAVANPAQSLDVASSSATGLGS